MTTEVLSSAAVTNLDTQPIYMPTAGEGAPARLVGQSDTVANTAAFGSALKNADRMARFPMQAKVKHVFIYTKGLDSNASATLTLDVNVAFSDSSFDQTNASAAGAIPASGLTGAITTLTAYSSPNKMFGSGYATANSGAVKYTEITYSNTYTPALALVPMWAVLGGTGASSAGPYVAGGGFAQDSNGVIISPGGFWDMLVVVAATAATAAVGSIGVEVDYVMGA